MWLLIPFFLGKVIAGAAFATHHPFMALIAWFAPDLLIAYQIFSPYAQWLVRMPRRFRTTQNEVWLTIDDGPDAEDTPKILALLAEHRSRATFFVIGEQVDRYPDVIRAIVAGGHEIAHHTHTHPLGLFWCASPWRVEQELDRTLGALRALDVQPTRFRPPAGIKNLWLARALRPRQLVAVGWSARGLEVGAQEPAVVAGRVLRGLAPGAILLMHEGKRVPASIRVEAIRQVLAELRQRGYTCVIPKTEQLD